MSLLANGKTKVIVQGITGRDGAFHAQKMKEYGTNLVAGVTPGKGGEKTLGVPVYDSVAEAVAKRGAEATVIFVPPLFAADAAWEALEAGLKLVVIITEGIPVRDMIRVCVEAERVGARILGPNCPGFIVPGACKLGIISGDITKPGPVGVVSRSGTLTYEIMYGLTRKGLGQSACIGIGGDPVAGTGFIDCLKLFEADPRTKAVAMIGEIGGSAEEEAAAFVKKYMSKPVVAFIAGKTAPPGKRMGHAGAIVSGGVGTAESKVAALKAAGIAVGETPEDVVAAIAKALAKGRGVRGSGKVQRRK